MAPFFNPGSPSRKTGLTDSKQDVEKAANTRLRAKVYELEHRLAQEKNHSGKLERVNKR